MKDPERRSRRKTEGTNQDRRKIKKGDRMTGAEKNSQDKINMKDGEDKEMAIDLIVHPKVMKAKGLKISRTWIG